MRSITIGDNVRYKGDFLRSIGCYCGPLGFAKGVVKALEHVCPEVTLAVIEWDRPDVPEKVNVKNLERTRGAYQKRKQKKGEQ